MARTAFIGLGVMGFPIAGHLASKGHAVTVYNRTSARAEAWCRLFKGERVTDKTDQRRAVLQLTSDGARVNARKSGTVEAAVGAALRRVSGRRRTTARDVLLELANQLERSASSPRRRV